MKKSIFALILCLSMPVMSCSNLMVHQDSDFTAVARTMDFPFNTGNTIAFGRPQQHNQSDLNLEKGQYQDKSASWLSTHYSVGLAWKGSNLLIDGVNDKGVYAAYLYLSDFTQYPQFDKNLDMKGLGIFDIVNFVLATADSTADALAKLNQYQIIANAAATPMPGKKGVFINVPVHVVIRDKSGHSAVIEWQKGKTLIHDKAGPVLTNAPTYQWQVKHAQQYDYVQGANNQAQFDGGYANGSGFLGLPGDWTSANRFARATQIIKHLPRFSTEQQAMRQALSVLESVQVPMGTNPSPTLWKTVYNLKSPTLYFYPMATLSEKTPVANYESVDFNSPDLNQAWQKYSLQALIHNTQASKDLVQARSFANPQSAIKQVKDFVLVKASGPGQKQDSVAYLFNQG